MFTLSFCRPDKSASNNLLRLAKLALIFACNKIKNSSTAIRIPKNAPDNVVALIILIIVENMKKIHSERTKLDSIASKLRPTIKQHVPLYSPERDISYLSDFLAYFSSSNSSYGNCFEFSSTILGYLLQHSDQNVEVYQIADSDHCFVVFGRDENESFDDYSSWKNAIIIDAIGDFGAQIYPAKDIPNKMRLFSRKFDHDFSRIVEENRSAFKKEVHVIKPYGALVADYNSALRSVLQVVGK